MDEECQVCNEIFSGLIDIAAQDIGHIQPNTDEPHEDEVGLVTGVLLAYEYTDDEGQARLRVIKTGISNTSRVGIGEVIVDEALDALRQPVHDEEF